MDNKDYRKLLDVAPALNVSTLEDKFKLLADYGGIVLAGRETSYGFEFVTWDRSRHTARLYGGQHRFGLSGDGTTAR